MESRTFKGAFTCRWAPSDGAKGDPGDTGNGIASEVRLFTMTADTTTPEDTTTWISWYYLYPFINPSRPYIWECTKTTYTDGTVAYVGKRIIGMNTDFVTKETQYAIGDSGTTAPTTGWATTYTATKEKWLWERTAYKWQKVDATYTDAVCKGYFAKDGINGQAGMVIRVTEWQVSTQYHNDASLETEPRYLDIVTVTAGDGTFKIYQCRVSHTSTSDDKPADKSTAYWLKMNSMSPIYTPLIVANNAVMRLAQTNQIVVTNSQNKVQGCFGGVEDETNGYPLWVGGETASEANFKVKYDGTLEATGAKISGEVNATSGTFSGEVSGITGSFKSLKCVDTSGEKVGGVSFDSNGNMTFTGDLYHQGTHSSGRHLRFYTQDIWCRCYFGHRGKVMAVVSGNTMGVYFGGTSAASFSLASGTTGGVTYYKIPLYGLMNSWAGMPIDVVVFNCSTDYYYVFADMYNGKEWRVINGNVTTGNKVHFADIGGWHELAGGSSLDCVYVDPDLNVLTPTPTSVGKGVFWSGEKQLTWK